MHNPWFKMTVRFAIKEFCPRMLSHSFVAVMFFGLNIPWPPKSFFGGHFFDCDE